MNSHKIGFYTAISIVIANMIGTGVFTSLGFQVMGIQSGGALLALWIVGGVLALCGALTYGEIGAAYPENGGEFYYLTKLYHPAVGFLSGWVSVTVGFAAPIAAASMALGKYVHSIYADVNVMSLAIVVIVVITALHSFNLKTGSVFQRVLTLVKVMVIILFVIFGISHTPSFDISFKLDNTAVRQIFSTSFATSLIYVTYAYSGWNAAAYLSGEIKDVNRTLPRALIFGTLIVLVVYTLLNFVFLYTTPIESLKGQIEIGYLSANQIFGTKIGKYMSLAIAVLLISTISAMILAGPRVMQSMGKAISSLNGLARTNKNGVPYIAIGFQSLIAIILVTFSSFESLINYIGFTLNLFTFLTVFGIFILRYKKRDVVRPFKTPLFPLPPILFLLILGWILVNVFIEKPMESLLGLLTVLGGLGFYYITVYLDKKKMKLTKIYACTLLTLTLFGCNNNSSESEQKDKKDSIEYIIPDVDTTKFKDLAIENIGTLPRINDTLNDLAHFISGNTNSTKYFKGFRKHASYTDFSARFSKRWVNFDSTKLLPIKNFVTTEFVSESKIKNLFYPFSGPDILYANTIFPEADVYTMIGLEPVGTLPIVDDKKIVADSIQKYVDKINSSLNAILKFSFFRTISMKEDLRNDEVDGTIHLLLLFLNKTGHQIANVRPFYVDTTGAKQYVESTTSLSKSSYKNKSIEITAIDKNNKVKTVTYTSTDLSDPALRKNKGLITYINNLHFETTYLKGASYLMHLSAFSKIRELILANTKNIVQDDSGIALHYITADKNKWKFTFYGAYTKPINMFAKHYQADLDSLYKTQGAKKLGFGLGYNYRDKNSSFMLIKKS